MRDLKYAIRVLLKKPAFAAIAIITFALGIGANTAIFSIINQVMLRPLPYAEPDSILRIRGAVSYLDLRDISERSNTVQSTGGYHETFFDYSTNSTPQRISGSLVSGEFFSLIGIPPSIGRYIVPEDDVPNGPRVVVISDSFWKKFLTAKRDVIGGTIQFNGKAYTIIGVMPPEFELPPVQTDIWAPLRSEAPDEVADRGARTLWGWVRMKPDTSVQSVQSELNSISKELQKLYPEENANRKLLVFPLHEFIVRNTKPKLLMLLGAVLFVLIIAGSNVGGLLLARGADRQKEMAIRSALGADRSTLIRQLLIEYLLLAICGGALGMVFAFWISEALIVLNPGTLFRLDKINIDTTVLLFTASISLLSGLLFGLFPAIHSSSGNLFGVLKDGSRTAGRRDSHRFRSGLVVIELTLALVLLIGGGLLLRSFYSLLKVDPGFEVENLVTLNVTLPPERYSDIPKLTVTFQQLEERLQSLPGFEAMGMTTALPFGGFGQHFHTGSEYHKVIVEGNSVTPGLEVHSRSINADYFRTMKIPLISGRAFNQYDRAGSTLVGIANESMVREYFDGKDPVGKRMKWAQLPGAQWITIVGVASDVQMLNLHEPDPPALYTPYAQESSGWKPWTNIAVRTQTQTLAVAAAVQNELAKIDPNVPVDDIKTMKERISLSVADRKFHLVLLGSFAALALVLAVLGLYGVISYLVAERIHDFGVRMALGAQPSDILRLVISHAFRLAVTGVVIGVALSILLSKWIQSMLFGVAALDPLTFVVVAGILAFVALSASYFPARRATKVDPISALRYE